MAHKLEIGRLTIRHLWKKFSKLEVSEIKKETNNAYYYLIFNTAINVAIYAFVQIRDLSVGT